MKNNKLYKKIRLSIISCIALGILISLFNLFYLNINKNFLLQVANTAPFYAMIFFFVIGVILYFFKEKIIPLAIHNVMGLSKKDRDEIMYNDINRIKKRIIVYKIFIWLLCIIFCFTVGYSIYFIKGKNFIIDIDKITYCMTAFMVLLISLTGLIVGLYKAIKAMKANYLIDT